MKKIICVLLLLTLTFSMAVLCGCGGTISDSSNASENQSAPSSTPEASVPSGGDESTLDSFSLRIEGNYANLYYGKVPVGDGNLQTLLANFDAENQNISIEGISDGYVSKINSEGTGSFGGWDGWCILLNGETPMVGISDITVSADDEVVLYYGDPWGVGFAIPKFEVSDTCISFSDALGAPLAGIKVILDGNEYTADANGQLALTSPLSKGEHTLQIALVANNGLCLALRFAPDFTFEVQ